MFFTFSIAALCLLPSTYHEQTDPTGETIVEIVKALKGIEPDAAKKFVKLYLGELLEDEEQS